MASVDARATVLRRRMVRNLAERGITDQPALRALQAVPRHRFVPRFWTVVPDRLEPGQPAHQQEFVVDDNAADDVLALVYDEGRALMTSGPLDRLAATSSVSAPDIVATMLVESRLRPGLRVLEIGTGSGYHAVLMAILVADAGRVTTIDIDGDVVDAAAERVARLGFGAMRIRHGDGALGAPDAAPFDRIVATVGCSDLSPAWVQQLSAGGEMLIPLEHGGLHPRVRVAAEPELAGHFTGHSGFVRIRGVQASDPRWPLENPPRLLPEGVATEVLPTALHHVLNPDHPVPAQRSAPWDLGLYLALRDRRASVGPILSHDGSLAAVRGRELVVAGPAGSLLRDRLLQVALEWVELGAPGLARYAMAFEAHATSRSSLPAESATGPWDIDRASYRQRIWLTP